ncbi:unnamed protein product [Rotaria sp. Silwood2]|nr:unnamed protein product [Rotaria sp. Silwood2]CAF3890348.1 unnamed protein product [Rotaria sp. Silwood2]
MRPSTKRTIITSKTTGRRYFLVRAAKGGSARRYYVCSRPDCDSRLTREADFFCRAHSQVKGSESEDIPDMSTQSDDVDEDDLNETGEIVDDNGLNENGETVDEGTSTEAQRNTTVDSIDADQQNGNGMHDSTMEDDDNDVSNDFNASLPLSSRQRVKANREIHVDETTGTRSFRDSSGRRRYLCMHESCTNMLKRQADIFCRTHGSNHISEDQNKKKKGNHKRNSAPPLSSETQNRFRSPFSTTTTASTNQNSTNGNHSEEYESPEKHNNTDAPSQSTSSEHSIKKRKHESQTTQSKIITRSLIPPNKIVMSTTTLLDHQWITVLTFLRQFPQIQLGTNLNVNNLTTHLLIDDSENPLHCTITKKIVQAAARRNIFIISSRWITECIRLNEIVDEHPFEITSDSHTTLRLSVQNFQTNHKYLFNNSSPALIYGFAIECRQCQGSINRNELIELIELTGAKLYDNVNSVDILIVLCDTNEKNINKIKEKYLHTNVSNIKYVISDFLLKSIIKFEIQDIDKYSL